MADRPTSIAKSVDGLHHEESALDRARALRDQFVHAQEQNNEKQKPREAEKPHGETEKSGSQMVKDDAPVLRPTPSGPMRQAPDRQIASAKLAKEHNDAAEKLQQAEKMREAFKAQQQQRTHDHERDRDR
jgi:hypothetical protein